MSQQSELSASACRPIAQGKGSVHDQHACSLAASAAKADKTPAREGHCCDTLANLARFTDFFETTIDQVKASVDAINVPSFSVECLCKSQLAFEQFVEYLVCHSVQTPPTRDILDAAVAAYTKRIKSGELTDTVLSSTKMWVTYLHIYAMSGKGRINKDTVAHTNLRQQYPDGPSNATGTSNSTASSGLTVLDVTNTNLDSLCRNLTDQSPLFLGEEGSNKSKDKVVLTSSKSEVVNSLRSNPNATPLSLTTIVARYRDIL